MLLPAAALKHGFPAADYMQHCAFESASCKGGMGGDAPGISGDA